MSARVTPQFLKEYKRLNAAQKEAVDTVEGPVMVIAGPGTGKTQILTLRIANIIKETDTPPDAILALTFTESGASAMRKRLLSIIGQAAYRVQIFTFHGFCNEVIRRYPDDFPRIIGSDALTDIEKISIIREIIEKGTFEHLKPFGSNFHYVNDVRQKISELKREHVSPKVFSAYIAKEKGAFLVRDDVYHKRGVHEGKMKGEFQTFEKKLRRSEELGYVYTRYEEELRRRKKYDFEDMIVEVVDALERDADIRLKVQEEFLYILADEHQDANASQNKLLELLSSFHEVPNLFMVGDEKQAIFRFQGASLENFLYFQRLFPTARQILLTDSYRSGQKILDVAHALIGEGGGGEKKLRKALVSKAEVSHVAVELHSFSSPDEEISYVMSSIQERLADGVSPTEIAVLYRTNAEAERVVRAAEREGVIVSVESDQNVLGDPDIRSFIRLLRAVASFGEDESIAEALQLSFTGIDPVSAYKVIRHARKEKILIADVLASTKYLKAAGVQDDVFALETWNKKMSAWHQSGGAIPQLVSTIAHESGFVSFVLRVPRTVELLEKLAGLLRDIERLAEGNRDYTLPALLEHLTLLDEYQIPITKELRGAPRKGAVRLMTAHKSKGLEFEYVYIVNAADGVWGGRRMHDLFLLPSGAALGEEDDERRLLYVALTRARLSVQLSFAREHEGKARLPTRFLSEMPEKYIDSISHEPKEKKENLMPIALRQPIVARSPGIGDVNFLQELFLEQGLSVTALNNYLSCPWNYFYTNLIRLPQSPNTNLLYGDAVHKALKKFFDGRVEKKMGEKRLLKLLDESVERLPLSQKEIKELEARGRAHLTGWYKEWHKGWQKDTKTEYRIETSISSTEGTDTPPILLRGVLDKLELLGGIAVRVVDYKTGKPKTRNEILGKTKSATGDYFRQLAFYKILLEKEGRWHMQGAALDFIQPDEKGKYHLEEFAVTDEDVHQLEETIRAVAEEIWNLRFWDRRCDDDSCKFCELRDMIA